MRMISRRWFFVVAMVFAVSPVVLLANHSWVVTTGREQAILLP